MFSISYHLLRLVCDVTCCVNFILRLWLIVWNIIAKIHMKLNVTDDLLSKLQDIFDPVLIMHLANNFFRFELPLFVGS